MKSSGCQTLGTLGSRNRVFLTAGALGLCDGMGSYEVVAIHRRSGPGLARPEVHSGTFRRVFCRLGGQVFEVQHISFLYRYLFFISFISCISPV